MSKKGMIFSGVQPTGQLHLGNYLGAIKNWVKLQDSYNCIFCVVDMHAITVPQDPKALRDATRQTLATYIACGINPETNIIYNQSAVPGHAELAWILGCNTPMGWLKRMTQWKDKIGYTPQYSDEELEKVKDSIKEYTPENEKLRSELISHYIANTEEYNKKSGSAYLGLYTYPVLMAADILLYRATHVPVGEDQKQHLELARDIAGAFNRAYNKEYFPLPEPVIMGDATRVMSLNDGTKKMSKSDVSEYSRVTLTDSADAIRNKFKKAKSDATRGFESLEGRPEAVNLLTIYASLTDTTVKSAQEKFLTSGFGDLKKELAEVAVEKLSPITDEVNRLMKDKAHLDSILKRGAEKANAIARKNLSEIKELVGFLEV